MFKDQVSLSAQMPTFFYIVGLIAIMLAIGGVFLFDAGLSRKGNVMHTLVQKLTAGFVAAFGMSLIGFAIWNWQYNKAFGIPNPLGESIKSWWLFGHDTSTFAQHLDPTAVPQADSYQAFWAIFVVFAVFFAALLAGSVIERVKTVSLSVVAFFFGALAIPFAAYLIYGSVGPLSNSGTHDFGGAFFYILLGTWSLVLVWRAKPRPGTFSEDPAGPPIPHNQVLSIIGLTVFLAGLCGYVLLNGFLIPGSGFFGITLNESGMGVIVSNLMMAFTMGALGGLLAWKWGKHAFFFLVSPVAGWIAVSGMIDVVKPWEAGLTAFFAPLLVVVGYKALLRLKLDDPKVVPLTLLPGIYSAIVTAVFATNIKQGGYFGLRGAYALQHASIGIGHQLVGVGVFLAFGLVSAAVVVFAVEKTIGLRDKRIDNGFAAALDAEVIGDVAYAEVVPVGFHGVAPAGEPDLGISVET